jgi:hypothetical protein
VNPMPSAISDSTKPQLQLRRIIVADTFAEHSPADEPGELTEPAKGRRSVRTTSGHKQRSSGSGTGLFGELTRFFRVQANFFNNW